MIIGIRMAARMIRRPGGDTYGRYQGWRPARAFLTSDKNQFPTNMAATSGPSIFRIVTKSGTVSSSI